MCFLVESYRRYTGITKVLQDHAASKIKLWIWLILPTEKKPLTHITSSCELTAERSGLVLQLEKWFPSLQVFEKQHLKRWLFLRRRPKLMWIRTSDTAPRTGSDLWEHPGTMMKHVCTNVNVNIFIIHMRHHGAMRKEQQNDLKSKT